MSALIKNGRIITTADDYVADIFIEGETISAIGKNLSIKTDEEIDASGMLGAINTSPSASSRFRDLSSAASPYPEYTCRKPVQPDFPCLALWCCVAMRSVSGFWIGCCRHPPRARRGANRHKKTGAKCPGFHFTV